MFQKCDFNNKNVPKFRESLKDSNVVVAVAVVSIKLEKYCLDVAGRKCSHQIKWHERITLGP